LIAFQRMTQLKASSATNFEPSAPVYVKPFPERLRRMPGRPSETYLKPADSAASFGSTIVCTSAGESNKISSPEKNLLRAPRFRALPQDRFRRARVRRARKNSPQDLPRHLGRNPHGRVVRAVRLTMNLHPLSAVVCSKLLTSAAAQRRFMHPLREF
jgi:hypothetical protein